MAVRCPYCRLEVPIKAREAGRFGMRCPDCGKKFAVNIPEDPGAPIVAAPLRSELEAKPGLPAATEAATGVHGAAATPNRAAARSSPDDPNATAAIPKTARSSTDDPNATVPLPPSKSVAAPGFDPAEAAPAGGGGGGSALPAGVPSQLGGYRLLKLLGEGGMGSVYLARQIALGRNVALKTLRPVLAHDPTFLARFTREAYAAAQLTHHNIAQIHDFGVDKGTSFFSMEFVDGPSLAQYLKKKPKALDIEAAVCLILQAARGLKFAHEQSMIHRDVKPENLLLNRQGVLKVADLGLVKVPDAAGGAGPDSVAGLTAAQQTGSGASGITMAHSAMGTPAFMAPEQSADATAVDARADIYALGCTFYMLVTGKPPFEASTPLEMMLKHQNEVPVPPERLNRKVPAAISAIILKMMAKSPADRPPTMDAVVRDLKGELATLRSGPTTPGEAEAQTLLECVRGFHAAPTARARQHVLLGLMAGWSALVLLCLLIRWRLVAGGVFGLGVMTAAAYFVLDGLARKGALFTRVRSLLFSNRLVDWLMLFAGGALLLTLLSVFHLLWAWLAFAGFAVLLAFALRATLDRRLEAERAAPLEQAEELLRGMRLKGMDEPEVRGFVARFSGNAWEDFYEALFGYDAKREARSRLSREEPGAGRKRYAAWRDPIADRLDALIQGRRARREVELLRRLEERSLTAQGVNLVTARRKAQRSAEALVTAAAEIRSAPKEAISLNVGKAIREAAAKPETVLAQHERGLIADRRGFLDRVLGPLLGPLLGPRPRFLAGVVLLGGCLAWVQQNEIITAAHLQQAKELARQAAQVTNEKEAKRLAAGAAERARAVDLTKATEPLRMPGVPSAVTGLFNGFGPGAAGLILLISSFFRGVKMSVFAVPAAVVAFLGPRLGIPDIGPIPADYSGMALGAGIAVLGWFFGRGRS